MRPAVACLIAMILGLAGAVGVIRRLEADPALAAVEEGQWYLPSPAVARRLAFGYESLLADLLWIRSVQYFGKHFKMDGRYPMLRPLLELAVGLDPHFIEAYQYGGLFLWIAGDLPATVSFLEDGYRHNPNRWEIPHDLGRLYFLQLGENAQALRWWTIAQKLPDSPTYLPRFIARLHGRVGQRETALELWTAILNDPKTDEHFRKIAREEIQALGTPRPEGPSAR